MRRVALCAMVLLGGCAHAPTPKSEPPEDRDTSPPDVGSPEEESTGTSTTPVLGMTRSIPASVTVQGVGLDVASSLGIVPAHGSEPAVIFVAAEDSVEQGLPGTFILPGDLPRGVHPITDLWDGVSSIDEPFTPFASAGDVNRDGHLDAWVSEDLFHGPFLGRSLVAGTGVAVLGQDQGSPLAGDFDADGDGELDVLTSPGLMMGWVYHGPFAGTVEKKRTPSPNYTQFGQGACFNSTLAGAVLPDALGPGHDAVSLGAGAWGGAGDCEPVAEVWDLNQPRGTLVRDADRVTAAYHNGVNAFQSVGDVDGDGVGDALFAGDILGWVMAGPADQDPSFTAGREVFETVNGHVLRALGDVNGDGMIDLLGLWDAGGWDLNEGPRPEDFPVSGLVVLLSPFGDVVDMTRGVQFATGSTGTARDYQGADLDGDGLADIVRSNSAGDGSVLIWYATDILAAAAAYPNL